MKRIDTIPKLCSRCGNDLLGGMALLNLPFEKRYISFCSVCATGLSIVPLFVKNPPSPDQSKEFWNEEIKKKESK